jgi:hypothetical protein
MDTNKYLFGLNSREAITHKAHELIRHLDTELKDDHSQSEWTLANFNALCSFTSIRPKLQYFYVEKGSDGKRKRGEFLWDFIAYQQGKGIFLAAESEQETKDKNGKREDLRNDFEKLLYVRAPLKLMICKADTYDDAKGLAEDLSSFASHTCQHLDPGSVLLLYCRTSKQKMQKNVAFLWQSPGEPTAISCEPLTLSEIPRI